MWTAHWYSWEGFGSGWDKPEAATFGCLRSGKVVGTGEGLLYRGRVYPGKRPSKGKEGLGGRRSQLEREARGGGSRVWSQGHLRRGRGSALDFPPFDTEVSSFLQAALSLCLWPFLCVSILRDRWQWLLLAPACLTRLYLTPADRWPAENRAWVGQQWGGGAYRACQSVGQLLRPRAATSSFLLGRREKQNVRVLGLGCRSGRPTTAGKGWRWLLTCVAEDWTQDHAHTEARARQLSTTHACVRRTHIVSSFSPRRPRAVFGFWRASAQSHAPSPHLSTQPSFLLPNPSITGNCFLYSNLSISHPAFRYWGKASLWLLSC